MNHQKAKHRQQLRRRHHVRRKIVGTPERPRLSVFRSSKHIDAQLIDDLSGVTLVAASSKGKEMRGQIPYGGNVKAAAVVGEKLAEPHVHAVLGRVLAAHGLSPRFALLVPLDESPARYRLYLQGPDISAGASQRGALATAVQTALEENPHYAYAVGMGQLASVEVQLLDPHGEPGWLVYERRCLARGQRAGDIKPAALDPWTGWPHELRPLEVEQPSGGSPSGRPRGPARTR